MAGQVTEHTGALTVLVGRRLLEDAGSEVACTRAGRIDVGHADLDQVRDHALGRRHLVATNVSDDDGAVQSDT